MGCQTTVTDLMKKNILLLTLILASVPLSALPVGNPAEATLISCGSISYRLGFAGDYVFNRNLELDGKEQCDINTTEIFTNAAYLAVNFCDRIDLFTRLGATRLHISTDAIAFGSLVSLQSELSFHTDFSWSIGTRATLWEYCGFALGLEGEYFCCSTRVDSFLNYDDGAFVYFSGVDANYSEWQVGLGVSYEVDSSFSVMSWVPYLAVKWAGGHLNLDSAQFVAGSSFEILQFEDLKIEKMWGFALGTTFTFCDQLAVTVEGRFADEKAFYVLGEFRF